MTTVDLTVVYRNDTARTFADVAYSVSGGHLRIVDTSEIVIDLRDVYRWVATVRPPLAVPPVLSVVAA